MNKKIMDYIETIENELAGLKEEINKLTDRNSDLEIENEELKSQNEDLEIEVQNLKDEKNDIIQDREDNYRPISVAEQIGMSERDFL